MSLSIKCNDAWEMIPLEFVDSVREFFDRELQASHPLREFDLFPLAKCERKYRYLIEEIEPSEKLWILDFERKKRIRGKTCYYFKEIRSQEELDLMMEEDLEAWKQFMKDNGGWGD